MPEKLADALDAALPFDEATADPAAAMPSLDNRVNAAAVDGDALALVDAPTDAVPEDTYAAVPAIAAPDGPIIMLAALLTGVDAKLNDADALTDPAGEIAPVAANVTAPRLIAVTLVNVVGAADIVTKATPAANAANPDAEEPLALMLPLSVVMPITAEADVEDKPILSLIFCVADV